MMEKMDWLMDKHHMDEQMKGKKQRYATITCHPGNENTFVKSLYVYHRNRPLEQLRDLPVMDLENTQGTPYTAESGRCINYSSSSQSQHTWRKKKH